MNGWLVRDRPSESTKTSCMDKEIAVVFLKRVGVSVMFRRRVWAMYRCVCVCVTRFSFGSLARLGEAEGFCSSPLIRPVHGNTIQTFW